MFKFSYYDYYLYVLLHYCDYYRYIHIYIYIEREREREIHIYARAFAGGAEGHEALHRLPDGVRTNEVFIEVP